MDGTRRSGTSLVRTVVSWGHLTGAALLAVVVVLVALVVVDRWFYGPRETERLQAIEALRELHESMVDQQVGLRGYLLSEDELFLQAYDRGVDSFADQRAAVARAVSGDPHLVELLYQVRSAQDAWIEGWAGHARSVRAGARPTDAFLRRDKALFDAYRNHHEALLIELQERGKAVHHDRDRALHAAIGSALAVLTSMGAVGTWRSRKLRRTVSGPLSDLLARLEEIRRGELAPRPVPRGLREFELLGHGLEHTAAALASERSRADRQTRHIEAHTRRQGDVLALAREVAGTITVRDAVRSTCRHGSAAADGARLVVWLFDDRRSALEPHGDTAGPEALPVGLSPVGLGDEGSVGWSGRYGRIHGPTTTGTPELTVPMIVGAQVMGVLQFLGPQVAELPPDAISVLETMAVHAGTAIEAGRLHQRTADLAVTDVLTGLANRRRWDDDLRVQCAGSARYGRPVSVAMVDVDGFKSYNDSFGHQAGDSALQLVARVLRDNLRDSDQAYRYGGEEFALVMQDTTTQGAAVFAERLRRAVEEAFLAPGHPRPVTVSIGVAGTPDVDPVPSALTAAADRALYRAKDSGRNCVVTDTTPAIQLR